MFEGQLSMKSRLVETRKPRQNLSNKKAPSAVKYQGARCERLPNPQIQYRLIAAESAMQSISSTRCQRFGTHGPNVRLVSELLSAQKTLRTHRPRAHCLPIPHEVQTVSREGTRLQALDMMYLPTDRFYEGPEEHAFLRASECRPLARMAILPS